MFKSEKLRITTIAAAALLALLVATLVLLGARPAEAAFPGANGKITFSSNRSIVPSDLSSTDFEIFAMNSDRTGLEQITTNTVNDYGAAWSHDGRFIAWHSLFDDQSEIFMKNYALLLPSQPQRLTMNTAFDLYPTFNHDRTKLAFASIRDGDYEIYVMDAKDEVDNVSGHPVPDGNGDNLINLTNDPANFTRQDFRPTWSPDGTKIAFESFDNDDTRIYVVDALDGDVVKIAGAFNATNYAPAWSPDSKKIVFTSDRDGNDNIYVVDFAGVDEKRLTKNAADDSSPAWSPDGKKIAFTSVRGGGDQEIFVMKAKPEGRKNRPKNLTNNDVSDFDPDWRPIVQP